MATIGFIEIPTNDMESSIAFYRSLFGWRIDVASGGRYAYFFTPSGINGGFSLDDEPDGKGITVYLEVEDIDVTLGEIIHAGGEVVEGKTLIDFDHGYYAKFRDTQGNILGLWSMK